jgi:hypothetical protein
MNQLVYFQSVNARITIFLAIIVKRVIEKIKKRKNYVKKTGKN